MISVSYSNRIETLYHQLKENLYRDGSPFKERFLVVPSPLMKSWLRQMMVEDPKLNIAMGFDFCYLNEVIGKLLRYNDLDGKIIPTSIELALVIEKELERLDWEDLNTYLEKGGLRRRITLSSHLATLFQRYGLYGGEMVKKWSGSTWQEALWKQVFRSESPWTYPAAVLENFKYKEQFTPFQIDLFGLSTIPKIHYNFFTKLSEHYPVYLYMVSPCEEFWSDICSDKEVLRIQKEWERENISVDAQEASEEYLMDRNALLANCGRMGRKLAAMIEEKSEEIEVAYVHPDEESLLHSIQEDMLSLRSLQGSEKKSISKEDNSIVLRSASSKRREIEVLYDYLLGQAANDSTMTPNDMIVMAPDITKYAPYIKAIFGSDESQLDFQIFDLNMHSQSSLCQGVMQLLELANGRWDLQSILSLFQIPEFQKKWNLSSEDIFRFKGWAVDARIFWGESAEHRKEVLSGRGLSTENVSQTGTWEYGLQRILMGYMMSYGESNEVLSKIPVEGIEASSVVLISTIIQLIHSLVDDLKPLLENTLMTIDEWIDYLKCLLETYFEVNEEEIFAELDVIKRASRYLKEDQFRWNSVKNQVHNALEERSLTFRENHMQTVKFCSMLPMRAIPSRIIALIGMQEGVFPKRVKKDSLDLMQNNVFCDYFPTSVDYDRYLFLESIISARDSLYISYPESEEEGLNPSLVVSEFLEYLDTMYVHHCRFIKSSYHHFDKNDLGYSAKNYRAAFSFYGKEEKKAFKRLSKSVLEEDFVSGSLIDIRQLNQLARNPVKVYLNERFGIYLESKDQIKEDCDLVLDYLQQAIIRKNALKNGLEAVLSEIEGAGNLPSGMFNELSKEEVIHEYQQIQESISNLGIESKSIYSVVLDAHCSVPDISERGILRVPAIDVLGKKIVGKIDGLMNQGIFFLGKYDASVIYRNWPTVLVINLLSEISQKSIISIKSEKIVNVKVENPFLFLEKYIEYYLESRSSLSLIYPDWVPYLLEKDDLSIRKKIASDLHQPFSFVSNDYLQWINLDTIDIEKMKINSRELFGIDSKVVVKL